MEYERPEAGAALFLSRLPISLNFAVSARIHGPEPDRLILGVSTFAAGCAAPTARESRMQRS